MYPRLSLSQKSAERLTSCLAETAAEFSGEWVFIRNSVDIAQRAISGCVDVDVFQFLEEQWDRDSWSNEEAMRWLAGANRSLDIDVQWMPTFDVVFSTCGDPEVEYSVRMDGLGFNILRGIADFSQNTQNLWYDEQEGVTELYAEFQYAVHQEIIRLRALTRRLRTIWNWQEDPPEHASPGDYLRWAIEKKVDVPWVGQLEEIESHLNSRNAVSGGPARYADAINGDLGLQQPREVVLERWKAEKGYTSDSVLSERRREVWRQLGEIEPLLFPPRSDATIRNFFRDAKSVRFKMGRGKR